MAFGNVLQAQYKAVPPGIQLDLGPTASIPFREHQFGLKGGTKFYIGRVGFYIGMDAIYAKGSTKSTWPNVGSYRYNTTSSILSPLIGYTLYRTERYNLRLSLKCNFIKTETQLSTDYPTLKNYLIENYALTHTNVGGSMHFLYRVTPNVGCFAELTYLKTGPQNERALFGLGITYNILNLH